MSEKPQDYKYKIPRNARAKFELFGITAKGVVVLIPFLIVAYILFKTLSGPPRAILPLAIIVIGYFGITQEVDGETYLDQAENYIKDMLNPQIHLWEETDHARFFEGIDRDGKKK
jgi:hypothetical protein